MALRGAADPFGLGIDEPACGAVLFEEGAVAVFAVSAGRCYCLSDQCDAAAVGAILGQDVQKDAGEAETAHLPPGQYAADGGYLICCYFHVAAEPAGVRK